MNMNNSLINKKVNILTNTLFKQSYVADLGNDLPRSATYVADSVMIYTEPVHWKRFVYTIS